MKNLFVVRARVSSTGGNAQMEPVSTISTRLPYNLYCVGGDVKHCTIQSNPALLATAMGPENVYLCFDTVIMAKVLTGIHERAGLPGLEELFSSANGYLVHHSPKDILMSPLHSLSLKMWILVYYMPYF